MTFDYKGKCTRCNTDAGYLNGKKMHTIAGILFSVKVFKPNNEILCEFPIFEDEDSEEKDKKIEER